VSAVGANKAKDFLGVHGMNPLNLLQAQVVGAVAAARWAAVILLLAAFGVAALVNIRRLDLSMPGEMALPVVAESSLGVVEPLGVESAAALSAALGHHVV